MIWPRDSRSGAYPRDAPEQQCEQQQRRTIAPTHREPGLRITDPCPPDPRICAAGWPAGLKALTLVGAWAAGLLPALSWALRVPYLAREACEERELRAGLVLVVMLMSSLPAHNVGRKTLKRPGSTTASGEINPGMHVATGDPPDPEGRIHISAAVAGERPDEDLSVVFAVRPDGEGPAARADPPSLGDKMPGQRYRIAV
jgi:hypothetical protein